MAKTGLILLNLGSPDSTAVPDVKKYLIEFLMDERVIDKPYWLRTILVKWIIVPSRAPKSAEAYKGIWWPLGSPLKVITQQQMDALRDKVDMPMSIAMRYGNPTPEAAYEAILQQMPDVEDIIIFPLYPHYAMSSYETAVEHMKDTYRRKGYKFKLKVIPPFYDHPAYIHALAESMRPYLKDSFDQVLFSYHGIPERHLAKTDPSGKHPMFVTNCCTEQDPGHKTCYRYHVTKTTELVARELGLSKEQYQLSYQSRLGRDPWLSPSTQNVIPEMPAKGIKRLKVVCPSFVSDCLETLEEINMEAREDFLKAGGTSFDYIPCVNTQEAWIDTMVKLLDTAEPL